MRLWSPEIKYPQGILPELLGAASGHTGEIVAESTERRWMMLVHTEISLFFGLKKSTYVMFLPIV